MNPSSASRRTFWIIVLALIALGTPAAGILFSYSSRGSPPSQGGNNNGDSTGSGSQGVVCFGQVDLRHGVTVLYPLQPGRVGEVLVQEGQTVPEGTALLRLEDGLAKSRVAEAQAALESAELRLDQTRKLPERHQSQIAQQQDSVEAMRRRLSAARHQFDRQKQLADKQLLDARDLSVSEDHVREVEALFRVEEKRLADLKRENPTDDVRRAEKEVAVMRTAGIRRVSRWRIAF